MKPGERMTRRLKELGWTQEEFARRVGERKSTVSQWLSDTYGIRRSKLEKVAKELDLEIKDLL